MQINHSEYQKKVKSLTDAELRYIIKDASEAVRLLPDSPKVGYYQDEINYCASELHYRKLNNKHMRPIYEIAKDIQAAWNNVHYAAKPYLEAMLCLDKPSDLYGYESGKVIVLYFLSNAASWRGEDAKKLKSELKNLIK